MHKVTIESKFSIYIPRANFLVFWFDMTSRRRTQEVVLRVFYLLINTFNLQETHDLSRLLNVRILSTQHFHASVASVSYHFHALGPQHTINWLLPLLLGIFLNTLYKLVLVSDYKYSNMHQYLVIPKALTSIHVHMFVNPSLGFFYESF